MAVSIVQRGSAQDTTGATGNVAVAFGSNNTAGNSIIVVVASTDTSSTVFFREIGAPQDTNNNQYFYAGGAFGTTPLAGYKVFIAHNIAAGANTVTVKDSSNASGLITYEVAGLANRDSFDKSVNATIAAATAYASGNTATTSFANELLIGLGLTSTNTVTWTVGAGYSNVQSQTGMTGLSIGTQEQIVASTGAKSSSITASASSSGLAAVFTFADTNLTSPAVTISSLGNSFNTTSGTHTVTATPAVNDLILIVRGASGNATSTAPTDNNSDGNGTYTLVTSVLKNSSIDLLEVWVRNSRVGSATSTVFTEAPGTSTGGGLTVLKAVGMSKAGSTAIKQSSSQANQTSNTVPAPVFGAAATTTNPVIFAVLNGHNPGAITPPASYYVAADVGYLTPTIGLTVMYRNSGETNTTITAGGQSNGQWGSAIVELDSSSSGTSVSIAQVKATLTASGGTQAFVAVSSSAIAQVKASITATGGTQGVSASTTSLTSGLISYWKLDDASGTSVADSVGSNTGTWQGTTGSQWGTGKINGDGVFNGTNNRISLASVLTTNTFTVSAWVFPTADGTSGSSGNGIFYQGTGSSDLGTLIGVGATNANSLFFRYEGSALFQGSVNIITLSAWNHVVVTYTGGTAQFYVNAVAKDTASSLGTGTPSTNPATIGTWYNYADSTRFLHGSVDEVGVWSRALTSTEVTTLYNSGSGLQYPFSAGVNASITQVAATLTTAGGTQTLATSNFVAISQLAATLTTTGGTQAVSAVIIASASVTQVTANLTTTGGTQSVATVNNVSLTQTNATLTATGGVQSVSATVVASASITQVAATLTTTGGTQAIATVNKVALAQAAATLTTTGGTQSVATSNFATIAQIAANLTTAGGTQVIVTTQSSSIAQLAATLTVTGGTQTAITNSSNAQIASTLTVTGGTQTVATVRIVSLAQVAATLTVTGSTQTIATSNFVVLTQIAAVLTLTGGTQTIATVQKVAITQVAANLTTSGGTQIISAANLVTVTQSAAVLTVTGGTQTVSASSVGTASISQLAANITATGGTQVINVVSSSAIIQTAANLSVTTGTQTVGIQQTVAITQVGGSLIVTSGIQGILISIIAHDDLTILSHTDSLTIISKEDSLSITSAPSDSLTIKSFTDTLIISQNIDPLSLSSVGADNLTIQSFEDNLLINQ